MRINTNVNAMVAVNQMAKNTALQSSSMEKLSTGLRINKAADDAAGLAISEKMRSQIRGMEQADRNVQDGISLIQTAEGALEEATNIAQRMRELTIQGANDTNTAEDREKINVELEQLGEELGKIAEESKFNDKSLLTGDKFRSDLELNDYVNVDNTGKQLTTGKFTVVDNISTEDGGKILQGSKGTLFNTDGLVMTQAWETSTGFIVTSAAKTNKAKKIDGVYLANSTGAKGALTGNGFSLNAKDPETVKIQAGANLETRDVESINLSGLAQDLAGLRVSTATGETLTRTDGSKLTNHDVAQESMKRIDAALKEMNTARSNFGSQQNRLEYTSANLGTATENLTAAESRIRDVDVAKEMIKLSKYNIITQASQSMAAQAKQQPHSD